MFYIRKSNHLSSKTLRKKIWAYNLSPSFSLNGTYSTVYIHLHWVLHVTYLEMTWHTWGDMSNFYTNTESFYRRGLSIHRLWGPQGSWTNLPQMLYMYMICTFKMCMTCSKFYWELPLWAFIVEIQQSWNDAKVSMSTTEVQLVEPLCIKDTPASPQEILRAVSLVPVSSEKKRGTELPRRRSPHPWELAPGQTEIHWH